MIYCNYKRADGSKCMNEVKKKGQLCDNHSKITKEEIKAIKSIKDKLGKEEFVAELHLNRPEKIVKIFEEVLLEDYDRLTRLRKKVKEGETVSSNLTKLSESISKRLLKLLEVSTLSEMEKMPDISELFDMLRKKEEDEDERKVRDDI